jgi:hypothetical protein
LTAQLSAEWSYHLGVTLRGSMTGLPILTAGSGSCVLCLHLQLNRDPKTRRVTNLHVAKYFKEVGRAALQALPILQAYGVIPATHPVLQHPAVNNEHYRMYAQKQAPYSMRLKEQYQLLETPVLGPVFTQSTPLGNMTSALATQDERHGLMTGAVISYAATTAAAYTQAAGVDLSAGAVFMLVTPAERDRVMEWRISERRTQQAAVNAAADSTAAQAAAAAAGSTAAQAAAAAGSTAAQAAAAAGSTAAQAAAAAAADSMPGQAAAAAAAGNTAAHAATAAEGTARAPDTAGGAGGGAAGGTAAIPEAAAAAAAAEQAVAAAMSTPFAPAAAGATSYTPVRVEGDTRSMLVRCACCKMAWCAKGCETIVNAL